MQCFFQFGLCFLVVGVVFYNAHWLPKDFDILCKIAKTAAFVERIHGALKEFTEFVRFTHEPDHRELLNTHTLGVELRDGYFTSLRSDVPAVNLSEIELCAHDKLRCCASVVDAFHENFEQSFEFARFDKWF